MVLENVYARWRHQMETFPALLAFSAENSPVPGEFPAQRPVTRGFNVFFDLRLNKRLSKQSWCRCFQTPSHSLRRHCNDMLSVLIWYYPCVLMNAWLVASCRTVVSPVLATRSGNFFIERQVDSLTVLAVNHIRSNSIPATQLSWHARAYFIAIISLKSEQEYGVSMKNRQWNEPLARRCPQCSEITSCVIYIFSHFL